MRVIVTMGCADDVMLPHRAASAAVPEDVAGAGQRGPPEEEPQDRQLRHGLHYPQRPLCHG